MYTDVTHFRITALADPNLRRLTLMPSGHAVLDDDTASCGIADDCNVTVSLSH